MSKRNYYCDKCGTEQSKTATERLSEGCSECKATWIHLHQGKPDEEEKLKIEINKAKKETKLCVQ